jgi:hypothetical protein
MKKTALARFLVILVSALFALSLPHLVLAHSPEKVDVYYDFKSQSLIVKITHPSNNPDRHFVKEVEVKKNGQVVQQVPTSSRTATSLRIRTRCRQQQRT